MQDVKIFKQSELTLKVNRAYDTNVLNLDAWEPFLNRLCGDRSYQKEAIRIALIYLASGQYKNLEELGQSNYSSNPKLTVKYSSFSEFARQLQMKEKLYADLDLATGTGKSYVMYGIAQIALGLGFIKRVLVLCPSLTIESGLKDKFEKLSADSDLKALIPSNAVRKNPSIVDANSTIKNGDLCVENIHTVYENTGSSIWDSFFETGVDTLVLNDESHHIFNKQTSSDQSIKKWKEFLLNKNYGFRYMLGFTGTAYIGDEYFADVIYRYSLRQAIEDRIVKNIVYVTEDESRDANERFQKIYQNHKDNVQNYPLVKPISILVTQNIKSAKALYNELVEFLAKEEEKSKEDAATKVLIVTSAREHKANVAKLKFVDNKAEKTEWIISVSMLTEGWDVKNVFQIIPWEDRAFNSKLLVAQVLGRGLRIPEEYRLPQPKVIVFNHKAWGSKIKRLADEVLEIETRVNSIAVKNGERYKYHFCVKNINYLTNPIEVEKITKKDSVDFDRIMKEGIPLESQSVLTEQKTTFETVSRSTFSKDYQIRHITWTIDEVVDKLFDEFEQRETEYKTFGLREDEYIRDVLPSRQKVEDIIRFSMEKRGNTGDEIVEKNVHAILAAFTPLLHKNKKSIVSCSVPDDICTLNTTLLAQQTTSVGMLRQGRTVYFTNQWAEEIQDEEQKEIISELLEDESLPRSALREINYGLFKTPVTTIFTSSKPERTFVDLLCKKENADQVAAWIKSRDRNFYEIEYSYQYSSDNTKPKKHFHGKFNPDFFLKIEKDGKTVYLVIEIKENGDDCEENKAKYRYAVQHFAELNKRLQEKGEDEQYIFHFLSPDGYDAFFQHLKDGSILKSQDSFRCSLENLLEAT